MHALNAIDPRLWNLPRGEFGQPLSADLCPVRDFLVGQLPFSGIAVQLLEQRERSDK